MNEIPPCVSLSRDDTLRMPYIVYILRTDKNTLYTGQTNDLEKRLQTHKSKTKKSAKYMRSFASFTLVYTETYETKSEALQREYAIKQLTKPQKEALIQRARITKLAV